MSSRQSSPSSLSADEDNDSSNSREIVIGIIACCMFFGVYIFISCVKYRRRTITVAGGSTVDKQLLQKVADIIKHLKIMKLVSNNESAETDKNIAKDEIEQIDLLEMGSVNTVFSFNTPIPTLVPTKIEKTKSSDIIGLECAICFQTFEEGDNIAQSNNEECLHIFHANCVVHWLIRNENCPNCRRPYVCRDADTSCHPSTRSASTTDTMHSSDFNSGGVIESEDEETPYINETENALSTTQTQPTSTDTNSTVVESTSSTAQNQARLTSTQSTI